VKVNIGRRKLSFFGLYAPEEGRVEENKNFYDSLQEILNKTNKKRLHLTLRRPER
jgi:hypothetical protein